MNVIVTASFLALAITSLRNNSFLTAADESVRPADEQDTSAADKTESVVKTRYLMRSSFLYLPKQYSYQLQSQHLFPPENFIDLVGNFDHIFFLLAASRFGGGAEADTRGIGGRTDIKRHSIFINNYIL